MEQKDSQDHSTTEAKKRLSSTIKKSTDIGNELIEKGREFTAAGQNIVDWAQLTGDAVKLLHNANELDSISNTWEHFNHQIHPAMQEVYRANPSWFTCSAGTSVLSSALNLLSYFRGAKDETGESSFAMISNRIKELSQRSNEKDNVIKLLKKQRLDVCRGKNKSPLEQFITAHEAFENVVDDSIPAITSLIPMRECLHRCLAELLRRRDRQERVKGCDKKIESILLQQKKNRIDTETIRSIAIQGKGIIEEKLTSSKQEKISRMEWQNYLYTSTLWLKTFLSAID